MTSDSIRTDCLSLQCLSNTQPLTEYFLKTRTHHRGHINRRTADTAIADSYKALIERMWAAGSICVDATPFKVMNTVIMT